MLVNPDGSDSSSRGVLTKRDWVVATLLMVATAVFVLLHIHRPILPMEDASMLLRYSQNVARGNGIVWNVGEHPVEGATDFLYMLLIGVVSRLTGVGVKPVAAGLLLVSHALTVGVLYGALRKLYRAPILLAAGFAALLGAGPGYHYVDTAFSAPFYGLFGLLTWYVGMVCVRDGVTWRRAVGFGALGFVTGLIRPDGVILAGLILCSTLYGVRSGWDNRGEWMEQRRLIVSFGVIFAVLGGAYFGWRLHYFGYPFPNPYYIKRAGGPQFPVLKLSARGLVEMLLPVLPLAAMGLRSRAAFRQMTMWLITVVPFTAVWMMISLDNNHFSRFQYVMVPLSMLAIGGMAADWWREQEAGGRVKEDLKFAVGAVLVGLFVCGIYYNMHLYLKPFSNRGAQDLAARLKPYAAKNYTMVVTEAGDLPFYSEWRAIDAFGLNDAYVAHHKNKLLTEEYLDTYRPEIILYRVWGEYTGVQGFQAQLGKLDDTDFHSSDFLIANDMLLDRYARKRGYVLAAIWGAEFCQADVYWVRSDFADRDAILSAIRDHPYYTQETGRLSYNFMGAPVPTAPCRVE
jgi:arabinofuranosyltransferase